MDYLEEAQEQHSYLEGAPPHFAAEYAERSRTAALIAIAERLDRIAAALERMVQSNTLEDGVVYMPIAGTLTADKRIDGGESCSKK